MATMTIPTAAELRALLRTDFSAFSERCFYQLNPSARFMMNWHIEVIASKLDDCRRGKLRRLIINVPPRSLKSLAASIAFPAWVLGHNPAAQLLCVSYAQDLSDKFARECRSVMTRDWYRRTFSTRLSSQKQAVEEFVTTANGYRLATSVGGVITGRGADFIIIDDPLKPEHAESEALRKAANQWYDNTLYSRLNDKRTGCIILIMQRLHEDDLVGHVLFQEFWEVLSFPAIAEAAEQFVITTPTGRRTFTRHEGDVLHPEREPLALLENIRKTLGERNFAGQYQQAPAPPEGTMVKREWFRRYAPNEQPQRFAQVIQSWDTANKLSELSDYSVCTTWGIRAKQIYLLDVFRKRLEFPDLKRAVKDRRTLFKATVILIEDRASGTQLIQELNSEGLHQVKGCKPDKDKVMRMHAQTPTIEGGFVYLPGDAPWLEEYLHELTTFPGAKYDDQADSTSQALEWINMKGNEPGIIGFYRMEVAKMRFEQGESVDAICRELEITPDELKAWIEGDDDDDDEDY
ncbi:MAG TPA: phage terminase large subunit [Blastocatellia bacterium]|nr:phage terminase large subunit [Blastocatellia bacterium]